MKVRTNRAPGKTPLLQRLDCHQQIFHFNLEARLSTVLPLLLIPRLLTGEWWDAPGHIPHIKPLNIFSYGTKVYSIPSFVVETKNIQSTLNES
jgi:hypothetical protein